MVVMVMVSALGLRRGLLLKRIRVDAVVLQDLVHGPLNGRTQVRGAARLFGSLDGVGDGRRKLGLQAGRRAAGRARRARRARRAGGGRRAGGTGRLGRSAGGRLTVHQ